MEISFTVLTPYMLTIFPGVAVLFFKIIGHFFNKMLLSVIGS